MSEAKHTPGPWRHNGPYVRSPGRGDVADVWAPTIEEQRANARLVAAAPDLLAACEALYDHLDGCSHGYPDELWDQAEAAIAKAKGETA